MTKINDSCIVCNCPTPFVLCDICREAQKQKCTHEKLTQMNGLIEDYDKCNNCGLEIPNGFPKQWNF